MSNDYHALVNNATQQASNITSIVRSVCRKMNVNPANVRGLGWAQRSTAGDLYKVGAYSHSTLDCDDIWEARGTPTWAIYNRQAVIPHALLKMSDRDIAKAVRAAVRLNRKTRARKNASALYLQVQEATKRLHDLQEALNEAEQERIAAAKVMKKYASGGWGDKSKRPAGLSAKYWSQTA